MKKSRTQTLCDTQIPKATTTNNGRNGNAHSDQSKRTDSAAYRTLTGIHLRRAIPLLVPGASGVITGGLIAAATAHAPSPALVWLVAYLVLVLGVAQIALAIGQALLAEPTVGNGLIRLECVLFNLGSVGVAGGTLGHRFLFVALGTILVVCALAVFLFTVRRAPAGYTQWLYRGLIGIVAAGACIGLILSWLGASF